MKHRPALRIAAGPAAALALALSITGCDGGYGGEDESSRPDRETVAIQPASDETADVDPCTLVDQGDLENALGAPLTATGPAVDEASGRACHWEFPDRPDIPGALSLTVWHGTEFFTSSLGQPLPGIGDQAQSDPELGIVLFRSGDEVVQVQLLSPERRDAVQAIARLAADAI